MPTVGHCLRRLGSSANDRHDSCIAAPGLLQVNFSEYDNIIVGAPTWNTGADEDRSGTTWDAMSSDEFGDLSGKKVACYGLGDSVACVPQ